MQAVAADALTYGSKVRFARKSSQTPEIWKVLCPHCSVSELAILHKPSAGTMDSVIVHLILAGSSFWMSRPAYR